MFAEVSDKEPTIVVIWSVGILVSLACFFVCRWRRLAACLVLPVAAIWAFGITSEVRDPYVGPAIVQELGRSYVASAYLLAVAPFGLVAIGLWRRSRKDAI
jgi:hypothetical protein